MVVCDPRLTQEDTYRLDGVVSNNNITDPSVVHTQVNDSYDSDNQGVSAYDYGNVSQTDTTGNDVGGSHIVSHQTTYPNDNLGSNIFLTDLPAVGQVRDGSGTPQSCSQFVYGNNSQYNAAPTLPGVTQAQAHIVGGTSGCGSSSNLITVSHTYDASGNPVSSIDGDTHKGCTLGSSSYSACATYDASTYNTHLLSAANALNQATGYAYDATSAGGFGQWLTSATDVNGQTTSYQYDVLGRLTAVVRPGDSTSSPTVSYTYSMTCQQGATAPCIELDTAVRYTVGGPTSTTKQWYDGWGRLIETQAPSPTGGQTILSYNVYYNDSTNGHEVIASLPYAIATPSGYVAPDLTQARSVTKYDGLNRSYGVTTYNSGGSTIALQTTLSYSVAQGVTGISSETGVPYEQTTALDGYNHQSIAYTDAFGRTRYSQVFSGTGTYSVVRTIGDVYDLLGDVTAVNTYDATGAVKASYAATYDAVKRLTGYNDSDLGSCSTVPLPPGCSSSSDTAWHFTYDADNNQLSLTDPRNQSTYASYDNLDRPLCRGTTAAAVNPCQNSTYALYFYDSYSNSSNPGVTFPAGCTAPGGSYASDPIGHATAEVFSSSVGSGWRCSGYDQRGQPDQNTLSVTADGQTSTNTMNMSYNDGGELAALVYPDQETLTSQYDSDGHLLSVYFGTPGSPDPVNFLVGQASYNNNGLLAGLAMGGSGPKGSVPTNSVFTTSYGYDGIQRPQSGSVTEGSTTLWSQARTYDNVGNLLQLATTVPTQSGGSLTENQSFCYDALDRLVWAGNSGTPSGGDHCGNAPGTPTLPGYQQSFGYDSLDRMTSGPAGTMSYDSTHVHAAATASSFPNQYASYDAMGNMTCRNVDTTNAHTCGSGQSGALMSYDNEGRLTGWTAPSGTTATDSFLYDNEGNRVLQRTNDANGLTDTITFDNSLEIVLHNGTTTTTKYYNVGGQRVAMRTGSTLYYLLNDDLGGTSLVLTSGGGVQAVQLYAPYGAVRYNQGTVPTTYNYTGQRLDSETGLLYYGFRYYDPVVGQFVRADSVETNAGGMNGYGYVGENPETKTDPSGQMVIDGGIGNTCMRNPSSAGCRNAPSGGYGSSGGGGGGGYGGSGGGGNGGYGSPPVDTWPGPTINTPSGLNRDTPDPNQFKVWGFRIRYASLFWKLVPDAFILKNGAAALADMGGTVSVILPFLDDPNFMALLIGSKGTNKGLLQAQLEFMSPTTSGWKLVTGFLGHLAAAGATIYSVADLVGNLTSQHPNVWSEVSDILTLTAVSLYYLSKILRKPQLARAALVVGLLGLPFTTMSLFNSSDNSTPSSDNRNRRNNGSNGWGGGGGGVPPFPPFFYPAFLQPQPAFNEG